MKQLLKISLFLAVVGIVTPALSQDEVAVEGNTVSGYVYEDNNIDGDYNLAVGPRRTSDADPDSDDADDPVGQAKVTLVRLPEEDEVETVFTDSDGFFEFADVPTGDYILRIEYISGLRVTTTPFAVSPDQGGYFEIPVVTRATAPRFTTLRVVNPANTRGPEVSPFAP